MRMPGRTVTSGAVSAVILAAMLVAAQAKDFGTLKDILGDIIKQEASIPANPPRELDYDAKGTKLNLAVLGGMQKKYPVITLKLDKPLAVAELGDNADFWLGAIKESGGTIHNCANKSKGLSIIIGLLVPLLKDVVMDELQQWKYKEAVKDYYAVLYGDADAASDGKKAKLKNVTQIAFMKKTDAGKQPSPCAT
jgi:hypothetical protein